MCDSLDIDAADPASANGPDAPAEPTGSESRFWIDVDGYSGPLEQLVSRAQRGGVDISTVPIAAITGTFRARYTAVDSVASPDDVADFLALGGRLITLKAAAVLADGTDIDAEADDAAADAAEGEGSTEAGRRLAEYRRFKQVADSLLAETDAGDRSFLGMVSAEVVPVERLQIAPEKLMAAFRAVLQRAAGPVPLSAGVVTFSVAEKSEALRAMLRARGSVTFDEIFAGASSRLEAVACFLGLLELLKSGAADVSQAEPFGQITVSYRD